MSGQRILLAMAGKRTKAKKRAALAPVRAVVEKAVRPDLSGVPFASDTAEALATGAGLSWTHFQGVACSGCTGFTAGDVRGILSKLEGDA